MAAAQSVRDGSDTGQAPHRHRLRVVGYLSRRSRTWVACDRPLRVVCSGCDFEDAWSCGNHRSSQCGPCSRRYGRRVRQVAESGTGTGRGGWLGFLTLTAIGARVHCKKKGCELAPFCPHEICTCTTEDNALDTPERMARWNASHSARWNRFRTALRRAYPDLQFMRGVEVQDGKRRSDRFGRGALHDHSLVWSPTPLDHRLVRRLAIAAGFGHSVDLAPVTPGSKQEAYYVSKYITDSADQRQDVPWWGDVVDQDTGEVSETVVAGRYRTWSSSRGWGLTMAAVRAEARERAISTAVEREALAFDQAFDLLAAAFDSSGPHESPPSPSP